MGEEQEDWTAGELLQEETELKGCKAFEMKSESQVRLANSEMDLKWAQNYLENGHESQKISFILEHSLDT